MIVKKLRIEKSPVPQEADDDAESPKHHLSISKKDLKKQRKAQSKMTIIQS
jgi:hypothetical protein